MREVTQGAQRGQGIDSLHYPPRGDRHHAGTKACCADVNSENPFATSSGMYQSENDAGRGRATGILSAGFRYFFSSDHRQAEGLQTR
jgi:hypothetical protein